MPWCLRQREKCIPTAPGMIRRQHREAVMMFSKLNLAGSWRQKSPSVRVGSH
jgi:hypothetical protein